MPDPLALYWSLGAIAVMVAAIVADD